MISIRRFLLLSFFMIAIVGLKAQTNNIVFEQITNESGRSLGFITGITQDETGFMWFATRNGLYRYNGYSYKLFRHDDKDSLSIPNNNIANLYLDNDQKLWMRHYDELFYFDNEAKGTSLEAITQKRYDIEVQIIQDKKGYYWVAPTGNGIQLYIPQKDSLVEFSHPKKTYSPTAWQYFDSILTNQALKASILNPCNNIDSSVSLNIENDGYYLIASTGEIDKRGMYDFASLWQNNELIWELSSETSMWSGGADKNVFEGFPIYLKNGTYKLKFKSDMSHCCAKWQGKAPNKINFCGTAITAISESDANYIKNKLLAPHIEKNYLASNLIKDLILDNNGSFWALTDKGLAEYNYKKGSFKQYDIPFKKLLGVDVQKKFLQIYQDKEGVFWIGSMHGLIRFDLIWGKYTVFQNTENSEVLTSNSIYSIFQDNASNIWIGTDKGLNIYNKELRTIEKITANNRNRLYDNRIIQIFEDKSENIWVATFKGLNRLMKNRFKYVSLNLNADNQYPVYYDKRSNIWYAQQNKVSKYSRILTTTVDYTLPDHIFNKNEFTGEFDYDIIDMEHTLDNSFWVASDNKVSKFDINSENISYTKHIPAIIVGNDSLKNNPKQILKGTAGSLYVFCPNGVYTVNSNLPNKQNFIPFSQNYEFIEDVDLNYFKKAYKDKKGKIWIRTMDGIYLLYPKLKQLNLVFEFSSEVKYGPLADGNLHEDEFGNIWFAILPEIIKINSETLIPDTIATNKDQDWGTANIKIIDSLAWIYSSNGLFKFNLQNQEFEFYSIENGLIDNNINGVEQDNLGYLWITSLKGLSKLDINEGVFENYFRNIDFSHHQFMGNHSKFNMPANEFVFFSTTGFIHFNPNKINSKVPNVVIDKFTIRGKEVKLDSLIHNKHILNLTYKQNFLGFEFAALDYTAPAKNRYMYKMEGLDEDWIYSDALNRNVSYPGLSPGKYTFRIKGANNDKIWNEKASFLHITITPPWYKTIVAYAAYLLLIVASIWTFIRVRERQLIEEKQTLEQKVKERTAEIEAQKEELADKNEEIEEQHKNITDSIHYAQKIQAAILPPIKRLNEVFDDFFILYRPRDIVSGDYYWTTRRDNLTIIVAADCTGHGVPGAFMSMLGIAFLNEIVNKEGVVEPHKILDRLRQQIVTQLHQTGETGESKDGMDLSLYVVNHDKMKLYFSGAYNPLYVIRNNELIQMKADRMPIGYHIKMASCFTMEEFDLEKGDCLYNSSDGYPDQFGGPDGKKFMTKQFKQLLLDIHKKPMEEQHNILNTRFDDWRGDIEPIDDVIVIGVRI